MNPEKHLVTDYLLFCMKILYAITGWLCVFSITGCQKELTGDSNTGGVYSVKITFRPTVKTGQMVMNQQYMNAFGEDYTVTAFRMYASHASFKNNTAAISTTTNAKYHLVDAGINTTLSFTASLSDSVFSQFVFQVGVDSLDNVSGAQGGDLDPAKGMFWTWNSGYVMAKLEGASSFSSVPDGNFTYHVGGFSGDTKAIRTISLTVPGGASVILRPNRIAEIVINADIDKWFNAAHALRIADNAFVHSPGSLAKQYADNYATMFSIAQILSE